MNQLVVEKNLPLYGRGISCVTFSTELIGRGSFLCLNAQVEELVEYCAACSIPAVSMVANHTFRGWYVVFMSDINQQWYVVENRGYGIKYVEFKGSLIQCINVQEDRILNPEYNGDGQVYSYELVQHLD